MDFTDWIVVVQAIVILLVSIAGVIYIRNEFLLEKSNRKTEADSSYVYPTQDESLDDYKRELEEIERKQAARTQRSATNEQKEQSKSARTQTSASIEQKEQSVTGMVTVGPPIVIPKQKWLKQEISPDFSAQDKQKLSVIMSKAHSIIKNDGGFSVKLKKGSNGQVTKGNFVALNGILKTLGIAEKFMGAIAPQLQSQMKQKINNLNLTNRSDLKYLSKLDKNTINTTTYLQNGVNSIGLNFKCNINFDKYVQSKTVASKEISAEIGKILKVDPSLVKVIGLARGSLEGKIKIPNAGMAQSFSKMSNSYNYAYKTDSHVQASIARTKAFESEMKQIDKDICKQEQDYEDAKSEVEKLEKEKEDKIKDRDKLNEDKDEACTKVMEAMGLFNKAKMGYDMLAMSLDSSIVKVSITQTANGTECNVGTAFDDDIVF